MLTPLKRRVNDPFLQVLDSHGCVSFVCVEVVAARLALFIGGPSPGAVKWLSSSLLLTYEEREGNGEEAERMAPMSQHLDARLRGEPSPQPLKKIFARRWSLLPPPSHAQLLQDRTARRPWSCPGFRDESGVVPGLVESSVPTGPSLIRGLLWLLKITGPRAGPLQQAKVSGPVRPRGAELRRNGHVQLFAAIAPVRLRLRVGRVGHVGRVGRGNGHRLRRCRNLAAAHAHRKGGPSPRWLFIDPSRACHALATSPACPPRSATTVTHGMDGWKDGMGWSQASQGAWGLASSWADARANRSGLAEVVGSRRRRENSRKPIANRRREAGSGLPSSRTNHEARVLGSAVVPPVEALLAVPVPRARPGFQVWRNRPLARQQTFLHPSFLPCPWSLGRPQTEIGLLRRSRERATEPNTRRPSCHLPGLPSNPVTTQSPARSQARSPPAVSILTSRLPSFLFLPPLPLLALLAIASAFAPPSTARRVVLACTQHDVQQASCLCCRCWVSRPSFAPRIDGGRIKPRRPTDPISIPRVSGDTSELQPPSNCYHDHDDHARHARHAHRPVAARPRTKRQLTCPVTQRTLKSLSLDEEDGENKKARKPRHRSNP
ncbi:hypothetical protein Purlil1_3020 [Purpureocillium lilacinum]|uniref:Uncharacterized protein n=1 Tax=Purpureocillium lilacinum TaxID=33203 RepID=A0ABR0C7N7_PURLI|nr:hypothetical protein Purlil1_3020 [Purpureocillium lilacinum]